MKSQTQAPGPGAYSVSAVGSSGPKYGLKGKPSTANSNFVPGPGAYDPSLTPAAKAKGPDWSFGKSGRGQRSSASSLPGPGNYNPALNRTAPLGCFGTARRGASEVTDSPGPGAYSIGRKNRQTGFSMASKHPPGAVDKTLVPGPGAYTPQSLSTRGNKAAFGTGERSPFRPVTSPGPGAYDLALRQSKPGVQ